MTYQLPKIGDLKQGDSDLELAAEIVIGRLGLKDDETLAILDDGHPSVERINDALYKAGIELCGKDCVAREKINGWTLRNASADIGIELNGYDAFIAATNSSVTHSREVREAVGCHGLRGISMPGIDEYNFVSGTKTDMNLVKELEDCVQRYIRGVDEIKIISGENKEYELIIPLDKINGKTFKDNGLVNEDGMVRNWGFGEIAYLPLFGGAYGEMLIHFTSETNKPFVLGLENGGITDWDINGEPFVKKLRAYGYNGMMLAELGFGTNSDLYFGKPILNINNVCELEKVAYWIHLGFGNNCNFGGSNSVPIHMDAVAAGVQLFSDDKEIRLWNAYNNAISRHFGLRGTSMNLSACSAIHVDELYRSVPRYLPG